MAIQNPAGVWGENALPGYTGDDRLGEAAGLVAATAIARGDLVVLSGVNAVSKAGTASNGQQIVGVALRDVAAGQTVLIGTFGPCTVKKDAIAINAGDTVGRSSTVGGTVTPIAGGTGLTTVAGTGIVLGVAMTTAAGAATTVDVFLVKI